MWRHSLPRYLVVGGTIFLVDLGVFLGLTELGVAAALAQIFSRGLGAILSFMGHKYFSFDHNGKPQEERTPRQFVLYVALSLFTLFASAGVVWGTLQVLNGNRILSKVISEAIMVVITYLSSRYIFRMARSAE